MSLKWFLSLLLTSSCFASPILSPKLDSLIQVNAQDTISVIIVFQETPTFISKISTSAPIDALHTLYNRKIQSSSLEYIKTNSLTPTQEFWVVPAITATLSVATIKTLQSDDIAEIIIDAPIISLLPIERIQTSAATSVPLDLLNLTTAHSMGYTGKGRLACTFDTGVQGDHPAYASRWRGLHEPLSECWFSFKYPSSTPVDISGHGTHTMGILVGDDFGGAPKAEWIAAGVIDQGAIPLPIVISQIIAAFQWAMNPDGDINTTTDMPDVISNSWGITIGALSDRDPCTIFTDIITNVEAVGILPIFAAGNESTTGLRVPADANGFAVGAINDDKSIASFSSQGPSRCTGEIKPNVVAPGVAIYSSYKGSAYTYMTGTSMSAPFIASLVLLARQCNPDVSVQEIKAAILYSCEDLGAVGSDNVFGYGLPDAVKMLSYLGCDTALTDTIPTDTGTTPVDTLYTMMVEVYPNPVADYLNIDVCMPLYANVHIQILNLLGQEVFRHNFRVIREGAVQWDSKASASGVYFVRVKINGEVFNKKILVLH